MGPDGAPECRRMIPERACFCPEYRPIGPFKLIRNPYHTYSMRTGRRKPRENDAPV